MVRKLICSSVRISLTHLSIASHRFFNDQELKNTTKTKIESKQNIHTLTLPKTDLPDEGVYKCVATNADGTIETKANLSVCSRDHLDDT